MNDNDLIRRGDALNELSKWAITADRPRTWMNAMDKAKELVRSIPAVDAVEVKHGRWYDKGSLSCRCSECGCKNIKESRYCPNCGAKMDGKRREVEHNAAD